MDSEAILFYLNLILSLQQKSQGGGPRAAEGGAETNASNENKKLRRTKSRELRAGIMYYSCHCIKRNGLQHDCRRTGCNGEPACLVLPHPLCAPSQLARARGLADPAPFTEHLKGSGSGGGASGGKAQKGLGGKQFIICELKGINEGPMPPGASSGAATGKCKLRCCLKLYFH